MSRDSALHLDSKCASYYDATYDAIYDPYSGKDYKSESKRLRHLIIRHKRSDGASLLDVPCGRDSQVGGYTSESSHDREIYCRLLMPRPTSFGVRL